ncbi:DNA translocase FtsK [Ralstonia sp. NT80]|uniref:DNA translocase FtsK n=1 Tax=Ralstonia sp. NT80 TaxID=1218247 RepID=UPI00073ECA57|nr:DNA translocase FtsK [Ralstonia sp. NT80]
MLFGTARELVISQGRASISMVQRHLRIGYNRAAHLLESLEYAGVVSPMDSSGVRSVLIQQGEAA